MIYVNNIPVGTQHFPDNTILVKQPNLMSQPVYIDWRFEDNEELFTVLCLADHLHQNHPDVALFMPYIPNARQDRTKVPQDVFTLKTFCKLINDANFQHVTVLDPHSHVSEALIDRIKIKSPLPYIRRAIGEIPSKELILFYPDEGAMKRYADMVHRPYAFGIKKRNWSDGKILGLDVAGNTEDLAGKDVLIVDDICSRGGTFYFSAQALKNLGVNNIYLYVTHCEKTIFEGEIFKSGLISKVFTTDSIFTEDSQKLAEHFGVSDRITVYRV